MRTPPHFLRGAAAARLTARIRPSANPRIWTVALLSATVAACSAKIGDDPGVAANGAPNSDGTPGANGNSPGSQGGGAPVSCTAPAPGDSPLRRLTRFEYSNTIRDLLGDNTRPGDSLPPEEKGNGFSNDAANITTTRLLVDAYYSNAAAISAKVTGDPTALAKTTNCDTTKMGEDACAQQFVNDFGSRAFRRPLDASERDAIMGVYQAGKTGGTYADGISAAIQMVLQSPQFLYKVELGAKADNPAVARPSSYEMATRLSYLLWGSMPDPTLLNAAKSGQLDTKEQVLDQAKRMLDDARSHEVVRYFHNMLLNIEGLDGLQRDQTFFPTYKPELAALFRQETEQFLEDVVWKGAGDFATFFTGNYTFMNGPLAAFYGVQGVTGDQFQKVSVNPAQRSGLLTQASVLTSTTPGSHNNPVMRGKFIYQQLLCGSVPDPPTGLKIMEPAADTTRTTRERFLAHRTNASCAACHVKLDNIGFGLEHYDGVGLWQDLDNGKPIDDSGSVPDGDAAGDFHGAIELSGKIAKSHDAQNCYIGSWLGFAYGRTESPQDACTHQNLANAFSSAKGNVKSLLLALTQTDAFLYRPLSNP